MSQDVVVRHCFQFRLRTLMIGVTVFCITVGGYVGWQAKIVRQRLAELNRHRNVPQSNDVADEFHAVPWIRRLLGDEDVWVIWVDKGTDTTEIERLHNLFHEALIEFSTQKEYVGRYY